MKHSWLLNLTHAATAARGDSRRRSQLWYVALGLLLFAHPAVAQTSGTLEFDAMQPTSLSATDAGTEVDSTVPMDAPPYTLKQMEAAMIATATTVPRPDGSLVDSPFGACVGWARRHNACSEVIAYGSIDHVTDQHGYIVVTAKVPANANRPRPSRITVWLRAPFTSVRVQVAIYQSVKGFPLPLDTALPSDPTSTVVAWKWVDIYDGNRSQYCVQGLCGVRLDTTRQQDQRIYNWLNQPMTGDPVYDAAHPTMISADVVVTAHFTRPGEIADAWLDPTTMWHYAFNPPVFYGNLGCAIGPPTVPSLPIALGFLAPILLIAVRRHKSVAVVLACASLCASPVHAASIIRVGDSAYDLLQTTFHNGTLGLAIQGMAQQDAHVMTEGMPITAGTMNADGSCTIPMITIAASNDTTATVEQVPTMPVAIEVDPDTCQTSISYYMGGDSAPDQPDSTHQILREAGGGIAGEAPNCDRPITMRADTYNAASIVYPTNPFWDLNVPWVWPGPIPDGWLPYLRSPNTWLSISGHMVDYGSYLSFADQPEHNAGGAFFVSWTPENCVFNGNPLPPWQSQITSSLYYVEAVQCYRMVGNVYTDFFYSPPSGYQHLFHLGFWQRPGGRVDMIAAFGGELPNFGGSLGGFPPKLPARFRAVGDFAYSVSGDLCPIQPPYPIHAQCPNDPGCTTYTNDY